MKSAKWYCNLNLKPQGPYSYEQLRGMIHRGQIGPQDLVFNETDSEWKPARQWKCFESHIFPAHQNPELKLSVDLYKKDWVLVLDFEGKPTQQGPYSVLEVRDLLNSEKISSKTLGWKSGLSGWAELQERPEFQDLAADFALK